MKTNIWDFVFFVLILLGLLAYSLGVTIQLEDLEEEEYKTVEIHHIYLVESLNHVEGEESLIELMEYSNGGK